MSFSMEQVRVALTKDPVLLDMLKKRKQMKRDKDGEYYPIAFNSAEIRIRPNTPIVLDKDTASSLIRSSYVIVGEDLVGDMTPVIEALDGFNLGDMISERFKCDFPMCDEDFPTAKALAHHMARNHAEELADEAGEAKPTPVAVAKVTPETVKTK